MRSARDLLIVLELDLYLRKVLCVDVLNFKLQPIVYIIIITEVVQP